MMKPSKKSDHDIEVLFSQLPKIEDDRKREDIYASLLAKPKLQKRKKKWAPMLVSFTAICLLAIISSTYFFQKLSSTEQSQNQSAELVEKNPVENKEAEQDHNPDKVSITENEIAINANEGTRADFLYKEQLVDHGYVTIGIPTQDAQYVVPLTFVYNHGTMDYIDMFYEISNSVNEGYYGLDDYFPLQADVRYTEGENLVTVDLPVNHPYQNTDQIFQNVLEESFRYQHFTEVQFETDGEIGAEFSHAGHLQGIEVTLFPQRAMYVFHWGDSGMDLFVPSERSFDTFLEALEVMKEGTSFEGIEPSIPENMIFERVEVEGSNVKVTLSNDTVLEDTDYYEQVIEAILLTARDFGFDHVSIMNSAVNQIGSFRMNEALEVPIAPNVVEIPR